MIESKIILLMSTCLTFLIIWMVFLGVSMAFTTPFAAKFFYIVAKEWPTENVVVSPMAVQTALASIYIGAEENTAAEIKIGAQLEGKSKRIVAELYGRRALLKMKHLNFSVFNRLYVDQRFQVLEEFKTIFANNFFSTVVSISFDPPKEATSQIRQWLQAETGNNRTELKTLSNDNHTDSTNSVFESVIYLNAKWLQSFDNRATDRADFFVNRTHSVPVDMMFQENYFFTGQFHEVSAKGFEIPLQSTNLSMLVLEPIDLNGLPDFDGLPQVETNLKHLNLIYFKRKMRKRRIRVQIPKFKFDFHVCLEPILNVLGIKSMFTSASHFESMLLESADFEITHFRHFVSIGINEEGLNAAAANDSIAYPSYSPFPLADSIEDIFYLNHPFFFAIKDDSNIYLTGHVVKF